MSGAGASAESGVRDIMLDAPNGRVETVEVEAETIVAAEAETVEVEAEPIVEAEAETEEEEIGVNSQALAQLEEVVKFS